MLGERFTDVAVERLRPAPDPIDTGNSWGDLEAWADHYADEMSSAPGRELILDALAAADVPLQRFRFAPDRLAGVHRRG